MAENRACGLESKELVCDEYEITKIRKTTNICLMLEDYAGAQTPKPIAIILLKYVEFIRKISYGAAVERFYRRT
jgi:hypothetical protein